MKATGIVRRIDDLGRVVIPKEIRRTMRIREGDPLEIYTEKEGSVIFRKYSLMGGLSEFSAELCDSLSRTTGQTAIITDRDSCIAVAGTQKKEVMDRQISTQLEQLMEGRQPYRYHKGDDRLPLCLEGSQLAITAAAPVLSSGDVIGCVLFANEEPTPAGEVELKLTQSIAGFLGKHMES